MMVIVVFGIGVRDGRPTLGVRPAGAQIISHEVRESVDQVRGLVEQLRRLADEQRAALTNDVLTLLSETTLAAERLIAEAEAAALAFEDELASDALHALSEVQRTLDNLVESLQTGSVAIVQAAASEADRTVLRAEASLKRAVDSVRPLLGQAERVGDKLIIRSESVISATVVRIASATVLVVLLVLIGIVIIRRGEWRRKWWHLLALFVVTLPCGVALLFAPTVASAFVEERELRDPAVDCREMLEHGPALMSAIASGAAVDAETANAVREAAVRCSVLSSSAAEASTAESYLVAALRALGAPIVCRSNTECTHGQVCDLATGECLERGVYCDLPGECAAGTQCDRNRRRCVPTAEFDCGPTRPCRAEDVCHDQRCKRETEVVGAPCNVPEGKGICRAGIFERQGAELVCRPQLSPAAHESCNGQDDDCDGTVDDNPQLPTTCVATQAHGQCRSGTPRCENGRITCAPGAKGTREVCGNEADEDCDGLLNNACPEVSVVSSFHMHCGSFGGGTSVIGRECPVGHVKGACSFEGPNHGDLTAAAWWVDPGNPYDCRCYVSCQSHNLFAGGDWDFHVTALPDVRHVP